MKIDSQGPRPVEPKFEQHEGVHTGVPDRRDSVSSDRRSIRRLTAIEQQHATGTRRPHGPNLDSAKTRGFRPILQAAPGCLLGIRPERFRSAR